MKLKFIFGICAFSVCLTAQISVPAATSVPAASSVPAVPKTPSGVPIHVIYRLFFRDIAALDTAADNMDAAGQAGGGALRGWYQQSLLLTSAETATLKASAARCNQALDQHQQTAQAAITAVQNAIASRTAPAAPSSPPAQLVALEQQRTAISITCIQNLQAAMGNKKFNDLDVFVRTKFAQKVSQLPPAGAPFASAAIPTQPVGGAK